MNILSNVSKRITGAGNRPYRQAAIALLLCAGLSLVACSPAAETGATPQPAATTEATTATTDAAATPVPVATTAAAEEAPAEVAVAEQVPAPEVVAEGAASALDPLARADMYTAPPTMTIDTSKFYYATLKTGRGDIKVQLFADSAPETVNNFVFLAREGYYNNTIFHRVLEGFMAQAGDPTGTGMGGPGYQFADEIVSSVNFDRPGLLAMANSGPGTNGSQFFITFAATDWLNGLHTIFGEVIEGQEILNQITRVDPSAPAPGVAPDTLYTVLIEETDESILPPPAPTPTPTVTPTPFAATSLDAAARPLATVAAAERANYFNIAPDMVIDAAKQYTATMKTSKGDIVISLADDEAPVAVNNFVVLANLGFYDGVPINQVSPGELIVIGSPNNDPLSDAGYRIAAETGITSTLDVGAIAYVPFRSPSPNHSSSQLLIALVAPPAEASADFSFFGRVITGTEVLAQLTGEDTIQSVTIAEQ